MDTGLNNQMADFLIWATREGWEWHGSGYFYRLPEGSSSWPPTQANMKEKDELYPLFLTTLK